MKRDVISLQDQAYNISIGPREKLYPDPEWNRRLARLGGRDWYGDPIFKVVWGWTVTRVGTLPRFLQGLNQWLVLRKFPPEVWGNSVTWYAPRLDEGMWCPSYAEEFQQDFPERGDYDIFHAFDEGQPFCLPFVEHQIRMFNRREKLESLRARRKRDLDALGAEEREQWKADYEYYVEASRPFGDAPMVGYGSNAKAPAKLRPAMSDGAYRKLKQVYSGRMARLERMAREGAA